MAKRKQLWFDLVATEDQAKGLTTRINNDYSYYMRKHHPAHYTPWTSSDGKEHAYVVWSYR